MEAYFNELSLCFFPNNQTAKDAFELLGRCLKKLSEMQVNNIRMTDEAKNKTILTGQTLNRVLQNKAVIDEDLKSLLMSKLYTLEPVDNLEKKHDVLGFSYKSIPCKGLGWASEEIEDTIALGLKCEDNWEDKRYCVHISRLDENGAEVSSTSECKHVVTPEGIEALRTFFQARMNIPTNGKVLAALAGDLFPHLTFATQATDQLNKIKDPTAVEQIYLRLADLERVASNSIVPISPTIFKYKTTPESETRRKLPEMKITFEDKKTRYCSWHSRFTPGAGRIHFHYDETHKIFYIGYIGEKIPG